MEFDTVFDITNQPCPWQYPAIGLVFVVGGIIFSFFSSGGKSLRRYVPLFIMSGFGAVWTSVVFSSTIGVWFTGIRALREGNASVVAGYVEHFVPMPYNGHAEEQMTVGGVRFS